MIWLTSIALAGIMSILIYAAVAVVLTAVTEWMEDNK